MALRETGYVFAVPSPRENAGARKDQRLVIVSNRLPIVLERIEDGWGLVPGQGGLVTALAPVLRDRGGLWIGWPGTEPDGSADLDRLIEEGDPEAGYQLKPVWLDREEIEHYYYGFSNEIIWPLFHDMQEQCNFDPASWVVYQRVNRKFAEVIQKSVLPRDYVWVHDYHLITLAQELRAAGASNGVGFFLHIPFPSLDMFLKLPWRFEVLDALLAYDMIGFQTVRDRRNFLHCVRTLLGDARVKGKGQVVTLKVRDRQVRVGAFAISIDFDDFVARAQAPESTERVRAIHSDLPHRQLIIGVDRLDYTKGIPFRLEAFRTALERYPDLHRRVTLVQVVSESRKNIPMYKALKTEVDRLVGEINGQFTSSGWVPIHYISRGMGRMELAAYYRAANIALVTPLKDGMNLVAKEYCASSLDEDGVLILSEFAGAAAQLQKGAVLVNPFDVEGVARAIHDAVEMGHEERRDRMRRLRASIRKQDIYWWLECFLTGAMAEDLATSLLVEDYIPPHKRRTA